MYQLILFKNSAFCRIILWFLKMSVVDKYRGERSLGGFSLDILKSGLQKYIRRGDIQKAVKCGLELNTFRLGKDRGETIRTNFFHRLQIILLEDVCNISLIPYISECLERYNRYRDLDKAELREENRKLQEGLLIHVITLMCESKKSRICSHIRSFCNDEYKNYRAKFNINEFDNCLQENYVDNFKRAFSEKDKKCVYYAFKLYHSDVKLEKRVTMSCNGKKFGGIKQLYVIFYELSRVMNIDTYIGLYRELKGVKESFLCWCVPLLTHLGIVRGEEKEFVKWSEEGK
jgi:hypothetical protein